MLQTQKSDKAKIRVKMKLINIDTQSEDITLHLTHGQIRCVHFILSNMSKYVHSNGSKNLRPYIDNDQSDLDTVATKLNVEQEENICLTRKEYEILFKCLSHIPDEKKLCNDALLSEIDAAELSYKSSEIMRQVQSS